MNWRKIDDQIRAYCKAYDKDLKLEEVTLVGSKISIYSWAEKVEGKKLKRAYKLEKPAGSFDRSYYRVVFNSSSDQPFRLSYQDNLMKRLFGLKRQKLKSGALKKMDEKEVERLSLVCKQFQLERGERLIFKTYQIPLSDKEMNEIDECVIALAKG
jgi:hypothetical protein